MGRGYGRTYLNYHMYKDYRECPQRYSWRNFEKLPSTVEDIPQNKILGIVWNDVLEMFYRDRKYLLGPKVRSWMKSSILEKFDFRSADLKVSWLPGQREEFVSTAVEAVDPIIEVIKSERLLALPKDTGVEEQMYAQVGNRMRIGGRLDMRILRDGELLVLDFKGSKHKDGRYLSDEQLYWYYILCKATLGKSPDRLGFWMLRFAKIEWVESSETKIEQQLKKIQKVFRGIADSNFAATPSNKACKWCMYRGGCRARDKFEESKPSRPPREDVFVEDGLGEDLVISE